MKNFNRFFRKEISLIRSKIHEHIKDGVRLKINDKVDSQVYVHVSDQVGNQLFRPVLMGLKISSKNK
jgi:hypothetical protein